MIRRVLLICYYFPPLGLGGVGRPLHLFKRLPEYGWECDVLTVKPVLYRAYEPELLEGLDPTRIHRAGSHDPQRLLYLLGKRTIESETISKAQPVAGRFFPDSKIGWVGPAVRLGRKRASHEGYDALISTSPPISSHLIGRRLAGELSLPWIADFRDFWTIYRPEDIYADPAKLARAKKLLKNISAEADAVTGVNSSVVDYLGGTDTITNGYDPDHARHWRQSPESETFTIGLLGHQHDSRQVEPLLRLIAEACAKNPELVGAIRILQVGQIDPDWFGKLVARDGLKVQVDLKGRRGREETIKILSQAHAFYYGISEREGTGFVPGRTFELVASGRPIFAYLPQAGEISRLLEPLTRAVMFSDPTDDSAVATLLEEFDAVRSGSYGIEPLSEYARQFSAEETARKFAGVLERIV